MRTTDRPRRRRALCLVALAGAVPMLSVAAQSPARRDSVVRDSIARDSVARRRMAVLPVVTTVGQRVIPLSQSTASVTVLDSAEITATASVSANQLLRQLPGLQEIPSPPSKTTMAIRGLGGSRVLVLIDGEPAPGALIDNRDIGRLSTIAAERIEVTKGPSSVEFGSDALGGVINLVTAAPARTLTVDATARAGGLGRTESSAEVSNTVGGVGFRLSGGWRQSDRVTAVDAAGSTLDRVYDVRGDARTVVAGRVLVRANGQFSRERQRWPVGGGYNGFIDDLGGQGFVDAQLPALGGTLRARVFGQLFRYEFRQAQADVPIAGSADSLEQRERLGRALLAYTATAGAHTIDLGAQLSRRTMIAPQKVDGDSADDHVTELFARDGWTLGRLLITAGVRSTNGSLWGSTVSPSIGTAWQATSAWRLRANVARGFRAPSFKEIRYTFLNPAGGYEIEGNPDLEPERSWSTALALGWTPKPALHLEAEAYRNAVSSLIDTRLTGTNAAGFQVYRNVNVASARTEGIELSGDVRLGAMEASLGYDYLRARDLQTGATLDGRARHTARARWSGRWNGLRDLATDVSARYTGAAPVGTLKRGAFVSVDAQSRLPVTHLVELSAGVVNLFDQRPTLWTPAFERQIFVGAHLRWYAAAH
jgi:outer membrane receptor for ferrienterochelin and colicins